MDLRMDDDTLKSIIAKSIIDSVSAEQREKLLTDAVRQAMTAQSGSYDKRSAIQRAFDDAVLAEANRYATNVLEKDEKFRASIHGLFADVAKKLFDDAEGRIELVSQIADVIRKALTKDRW